MKKGIVWGGGSDYLDTKGERGGESDYLDTKVREEKCGCEGLSLMYGPQQSEGKGLCGGGEGRSVRYQR